MTTEYEDLNGRPRLNHPKLTPKESAELTQGWAQRYCDAPPIKAGTGIKDKDVNPAGDVGLWLPQHDDRFKPASTHHADLKHWEKDMTAQIMDPDSPLQQQRTSRDRLYRDAIKHARLQPEEDGRRADLERLTLAQRAEKTGWDAWEHRVVKPEMQPGASNVVDGVSVDAVANHTRMLKNHVAAHRNTLESLIAHDHQHGHPVADLSRDLSQRHYPDHVEPELREQPYTEHEVSNWLNRPGREKSSHEQAYSGAHGWDQTKYQAQDHMAKVGSARHGRAEQPWWLPEEHRKLNVGQTPESLRHEEILAEGIRELDAKHKAEHPDLTPEKIQQGIYARRERETSQAVDGEGRGEGKQKQGVEQKPGLERQPGLVHVEPKISFDSAQSMLTARREAMEQKKAQAMEGPAIAQPGHALEPDEHKRGMGMGM